MKRLIAMILMLSLCGCLFAGCGAGSVETASGQQTESSHKLSVVTTIFPLYDWMRQISGDQAELTMLLDNGVDLHSYQPTVDDIIRISTCDMFVYVGGESDQWVEDALKEAANRNMVTVNLLEVLGDRAREEEIVAGMEGEPEEEPEYDEHVWLSLKNAAFLCQYLSDQLQTLDPDGAGAIAERTEDYLKQLEALDAAFQEAVDAAARRTVLFGDRFPFRYLTEDYGLDYYAAFTGCSAETEASFETVVFLAGKIDELGLPVILQIESSDGTIAKTILENTKTKNQEILTMDSLQSATSADVQAGITYLSVMQKNLDVLKTALA